MLVYLWLGLGGALGTMARYWMNGIVSNSKYLVAFQSFPWGTLVINVTGSFIIAFFAAMTAPGGRWLAPSNFRLFFMTGLCGGYTTFSSFSLQTLELARSGQWRQAGLNVAASVILCLAAAWLGFIAAASLQSSKGS